MTERSDSPANQPPLQDNKIVVVEDELIVAFALESNLKQAGAKVVLVFTTLEEASVLLGGMDFDVAILDMRMPDGQSYDLADQLLKKRIPTVIHSGYKLIESEADLANAEICPKPATPEKIVEAVQNAKHRMGKKRA